jgi:hypothetical protein
METLENTIKTLQTGIEKRDVDWENAIVKIFEEQAKKFTDPDYIKKLQEKQDDST